MDGSTSPLGSEGIDYIPFYPYFFLKDLVAFLIFLAILSTLVFFYPNLLSDADNYIKSNPLVTPAHIVPEWYFLFFYAILRSIPNKLLGVLYLVISLLIIFLVPFIDSGICQVGQFRPMFQFWFWSFICNLAVISWLGAQIVDEPFICYSKISILNFFIDIFVFLPLVNLLESDCHEKK